MPNKKMKRIKVESGVGEKAEEEAVAADEHALQQHQQQQQHQHQQQQQPPPQPQPQPQPPQRRKVDKDGHAVLELPSQIALLRAHAETQVAAIRGMEQAWVMREQMVELKAEIRIKDATFQAKDTALQASAVALK